MIRTRRSRSERAAVGTLLMAALALTALPGCCSLLLDLANETETESSPPPPPTTPGAEPPLVGDGDQIVITGSLVNLGVVTYPAGTPAAGAAMHAWTALKLRPTAHKLGYGLEAQEQRAVEDDFQKYARQMHYKASDKGRFVWAPPKGCEGDMRCVLERLAARSSDDIAPIAERFRRRVKEGKLNSMDAASILVGFVQSIRYEVPKTEPFGLLPPARVAYEKRGDCDSKALLGYMLLSALGIDSVMISSEAHKHAMLGIALPASGTGFTHAGRRYAYAETTAKGSPIGHINPELLRPNDWRVVPVRLPGSAGVKGGT